MSTKSKRKIIIKHPYFYFNFSNQDFKFKYLKTSFECCFFLNKNFKKLFLYYVNFILFFTESYQIENFHEYVLNFLKFKINKS